MNEGTCRGCGAPIYWVAMESGKLMPVDQQELAVVTRDGHLVKGFEPHWAKCRKAAQFKK